MTRVCTVCAHEESFAINEDIVIGITSIRAIASHYGLNRESVRRHKEHIPQLLLQACNDMQGYEADAILLRVEHLENETLQLLEDEKASSEVDRRIILQAIREQRGNIELIAKIKQLIDLAPKTEIVLISPHVQTVIIGALRSYPEARQAVADSLASLEAAS